MKRKKTANYPELQSFAKRLRSLREEKEWTQAEFGGQLGGENTPVAPVTISAWELANKRPTVDTLMKIAKLFSVSIDYLLGLEDERKKSTTTNIYSAYESLHNILDISFFDRTGLALLTINIKFLNYLKAFESAKKASKSLNLNKEVSSVLLDSIKSSYESSFYHKEGKSANLTYYMVSESSYNSAMDILFRIKDTSQPMTPKEYADLADKALSYFLSC